MQNVFLTATQNHNATELTIAAGKGGKKEQLSQPKFQQFEILVKIA